MGIASFSVLGAVLVTVVVYATLRTDESSRTAATGVRTVIATAPSPTPVPVHALPPQTASTDDLGFTAAAARCPSSQSPRAIGRTARSLIVVCADDNGEFSYHGVRSSDGAALDAVATRTAAASTFLAHSGKMSYLVSRHELVVSNGTAVVRREPMLEFRELVSTPAIDAPR